MLRDSNRLMMSESRNAERLPVGPKYQPLPGSVGAL